MEFTLREVWPRIAGVSERAQSRNAAWQAKSMHVYSEDVNGAYSQESGAGMAALIPCDISNPGVIMSCDQLLQSTRMWCSVHGMED